MTDPRTPDERWLERVLDRMAQGRPLGPAPTPSRNRGQSQRRWVAPLAGVLVAALVTGAVLVPRLLEPLGGSAAGASARSCRVSLPQSWRRAIRDGGHADPEGNAQNGVLVFPGGIYPPTGTYFDADGTGVFEVNITSGATEPIYQFPQTLTGSEAVNLDSSFNGSWLVFGLTRGRGGSGPTTLLAWNRASGAVTTVVPEVAKGESIRFGLDLGQPKAGYLWWTDSPLKGLGVLHLMRLSTGSSRAFRVTFHYVTRLEPVAYLHGRLLYTYTYLDRQGIHTAVAGIRLSNGSRVRLSGHLAAQLRELGPGTTFDQVDGAGASWIGHKGYLHLWPTGSRKPSRTLLLGSGQPATLADGFAVFGQALPPTGVEVAEVADFGSRSYAILGQGIAATSGSWISLLIQPPATQQFGTATIAVFNTAGLPPLPSCHA